MSAFFLACVALLSGAGPVNAAKRAPPVAPDAGPRDAGVAAPDGSVPTESGADGGVDWAGQRFVLVEVVDDEAFTATLKVNDFDVTVFGGAHASGWHFRDFEGLMKRYYVVHPYFMKPCENDFTVSSQFEKPDPSTYADSPYRIWRLQTQVVETNTTLQPPGYHPVRVLLKPEPPIFNAESPGDVKTVSTRAFTPTVPVPRWRWVSGVKIKPGAATTESLYAAYHQVWRTLKALHDVPTDAPGPSPTETLAEYKASADDFVRASQWHGKRFTFIDELVDAATKLALPGQRPPSTGGPPPKYPKGVLDAPTHNPDDPVLPGAPPRLRLKELPALGATTLNVFANGTLASLTTTDGRPLLEFVSNYHDGPWGQANSTKFEAHLWFRQDAQGAWQLDAVLPGPRALSDSLGTVLEQLPY